MGTKIRGISFAIIGILLLCAAAIQATPASVASSSADSRSIRSSVLRPRPTPLPRPSATITVTNTNDSGPGSLRQALTDAQDGDVIHFAPALHGQSITLTSGELVVDKSITISGPGTENLTLDGNSNGRVFHIGSGTIVNISGLTVTRGDAGDFGVGGGILNDHATLTISNCAVNLNGAAGGGGIFNDGSNGSATLTIINSTVSRNGYGSGAGIINDIGDAGDATLTVINSAVSDNVAIGSSAGGIANSGVAVISNSSISGNSAPRVGGGIFNVGTLTIVNSTISGNSVGSPMNGLKLGGGVCNLSGTLTIVNSTFSGNGAFGNDLKGHGLGGAIYTGPFESGFGTVTTLALSNSTLSGNQANNGGGIYNFGGPGDTTLAEISNTILNAGASGENILNDGGTVSSDGYNLSSDDGGGNLNGPGDQINTDPMLGPLQDNGGPTFTHALLPGSPAIDAGDPSFTPPPFQDQRGTRFRRVFNGRLDIGSFETQPQPPPLPTPRPRGTPCPCPTMAPR